MYHHRRPNALCFGIGEAKENAVADAQEHLVEHAEPPCVGAVIKNIDGQMPQPPHRTQHQNTASGPKLLLQKGLQKTAPAVLFPKEGGEGQHEAERHKRQIKKGDKRAPPLGHGRVCGQ